MMRWELTFGRPNISFRSDRQLCRRMNATLSRISGIVGAKVKVTLEIEADVPEGVPDDVIRVVTQNSRDLKFDSQGFEAD